MPAHDWLCRYQYDALDRLVSRLPDGTNNERCFYQAERLSTVVEGQRSSSWLQTASQILSQQQQNPSESARVLIGSDQSRSVIHGLTTSGLHAYTYTPYGYRQPADDHRQLPGFNRERPDPVTGHYLLGNGYRAFNPVLMRFNSPDNLSPFTDGALGAYAYCAGDPINRLDPTGHLPIFPKKILRPIGLIRTRSQADMQSGLRSISPRSSVSSTNTQLTVLSDSQDFDLIDMTKQPSKPVDESKGVVESKKRAAIQHTASSDLGMSYLTKRANSKKIQKELRQSAQSTQGSIRTNRSVQERP